MSFVKIVFFAAMVQLTAAEGEVSPAEFLKALDQDGDGKITPEELLHLTMHRVKKEHEHLRRQFAGVDKDQDKHVTLDEHRAGMRHGQAEGEGPSEEEILKTFNSKDTNGDGKISVAEHDTHGKIH